MLTLQINNPDIEHIFFEGFNANKELFLKFIRESYQKNKPDTKNHSSNPHIKPWSDFVESTYGSLSQSPIKRYDQGIFETREPLA